MLTIGTIITIVGAIFGVASLMKSGEIGCSGVFIIGLLVLILLGGLFLAFIFFVSSAGI